MRHVLLLSALGIGLLSSCSTAFKSGQTPDDVYFSPGKEMVSSEKEERVQKQEEEQYQEYISSLDDRYLRMKVANRYRWSAIDNFDYWYDSRYDFNTYNYGFNNYGYNTWNPNWCLNLGYGYRRYYPGNGFGWNSPIYTVVSYTNPKYGASGSTSGSNISAYRNKTYNNNNYGYKDPKTGAFVPGAGNSSFGNLLKRVFSGSETTQQSYDRPARTYTQPSNTNSTTTPTPPPTTSSNAGGSSGGYTSTGTSTSTGRGGRGN
ncbi:MAG: hypothetical protein V4539_05170 [Bacteroidota bacterium]